MNTLEQVFEANVTYEPASRVIPEDAIRQRAYEIYLRRGMEDGRADEDWFEAETELRGEAQAH
jgi:hypothetical protein